MELQYPFSYVTYENYAKRPVHPLQVRKAMESLEEDHAILQNLTHTINKNNEEKYMTIIAEIRLKNKISPNTDLVEEIRKRHSILHDMLFAGIDMNEPIIKDIPVIPLPKVYRCCLYSVNLHKQKN